MSAQSRTFLGTTLLAAGHGGIARVARMTAKTLIDHGNDPTILSLLDETPVRIANKEAALARGSRFNYIARCHAAAFFHDRFLYDSVGTARAHPRIPGLRRPYGVWIHGVEVWDGLSADRERALRAADFVLVNSQFTLDKFQEIHGPLTNAHVCWLATEEDEPPHKIHKFDGTPTAFLIGRSDKDNFRKGHKEVIESWAQVTAAIPDAELYIAGGGDGLDLLRETASLSPVSDRIHILGFVPEADMPELWSKAHVFVQPSWKEGFGLVYAEAMRQGLPVIASVHDAGQEVNVDGTTGYNVDLNKPEELAERIISLLSNPGLAKTMGRAGQDRWQEHFRFSAFSARLMSLLKTELYV
ncbi:MAG: glycosyltransferase family 4 protein [Rhizobiaceae bacterium]